jgi:hypothetical protein
LSSARWKLRVGEVAWVYALTAALQVHCEGCS